jgi:hypothetical protein
MAGPPRAFQTARLKVRHPDNPISCQLYSLLLRVILGIIRFYLSRNQHPLPQRTDLVPVTSLLVRRDSEPGDTQRHGETRRLCTHPQQCDVVASFHRNPLHWLASVHPLLHH